LNKMLMVSNKRPINYMFLGYSEEHPIATSELYHH